MNEQNQAAKTYPASLGVGSPHPQPVVSVSKTNLLGAMQRVMQQVGYVQKTGENEFHHYSYATEADTIAALRPAMLKEGLVLTPSVFGAPHMDEHGNIHIVMAYTLWHAPSGEAITFYIPAAGNDRSNKGTVGDKGIYKAMTGAMKYALRQAFMLETGDDPERGTDADAAATNDQNKVQHLLKVADTLIELTRQCGSEEELLGLWRSNLGNIDLLKREHHELHERVVDAFKKRKEFLSQPKPEQGGN